MPSEESLWFRLGYALERARHAAPSAGKRLDGLAARGRRARAFAPRDEAGAGLPTEELLSEGLATIAGKVLDFWRPRREMRFSRLLRAAAAGAGAALVLDLAKPLFQGRRKLGVPDARTVDRVLAGLAQGLVYGSVIEPRLPGPAFLKGALFGSAEYAARGAGGIAHLLRAHASYALLPVIGYLLEDIDPHDRDYLEHLVFGIVVGLLYGSSPSSNGIAVDDEDAEDEVA
jgi:hypothetical protein